MNPGGTAALAVGAGYVIGRQHKLRAVLMLGAAAATGRLMSSQTGSQQNGGGQGAGGGAGLLGKVGDAGKSAAISAVGRSADRIGERLSEMAMTMRGGDGVPQDDRSGDEEAGTDASGNGAKQAEASADEPDAGTETDGAQDSAEEAKSASEA